MEPSLERRARSPRAPGARPSFRSARALAALLAAAALGLAAAASGQEDAAAEAGAADAAEDAAPEAEAERPGPLVLELNKLESREGACRVYLVLENRTESSLEELRLDLVLFGDDGVILRRLAVDAGPLVQGRTRVRLFDVEEVACERIGRLLLNGVLACQDTAGEPVRCGERVELRTRTETPFDR